MTDAIKLTVYLVGVAISLIYYNKKISIMQSKEMKRLYDSKKFKDTKRIKRIREK